MEDGAKPIATKRPRPESPKSSSSSSSKKKARQEKALPFSDPNNECSMTTRFTKQFGHLVKCLPEKTDTQLYFSSEGLSAMIMDASSVACYEFFLGNETFFDSTIDCKQPGVRGVNLEKIREIFRAAPAECYLQLALLPMLKESIIRWRFVNATNQSKAACQIDYKSLEIDMPRFDAPPPENHWVIELPRKLWGDVMTKLDALKAEEVIFSIAKADMPHGFTLSLECPTATSTCTINILDLTTNNDAVKLIEYPEEYKPLHEKYAQKWLHRSKLMCGAEDNSDKTDGSHTSGGAGGRIRLFLASALPIRFRILIVGSNWDETDPSKRAFLEMCVAPKIFEDEEENEKSKTGNTSKQLDEKEATN